MRHIVECVPNFSEGRDPGVIKRIAEAITGVPGVKFLSAEPDKDYNRTVVTFVGEPEGVLEAAFQATARAAELIDMTRHAGEHPRLGATDVVPFVPVAGVTMEDCVRLARRYGERVAGELGIPVYLYEEAASRPERKNLATIRKGEYEGLQAKLADPAWVPDFGRAEFNARSGATVTGARSFLIAYNVNLSTADVAVASEIAARVRESGRVQKDDTGASVLDASGNKIVIPGTLRAVKAMGVLLEAHSIAQVSMNLVNFTVTPPHVAFEEVAAQARSLGVQATGSEIVGLTPREALLLAGRHYASDASMPDERLLDLAIERLGLSQLEPFDRRKKIIEYQL
ncbi:MAG: Formimidoyltransferase-cyclodeaminase (Formiminotransferase-cyclodeaminase) [candidate division NC10 bacterium]|nr:Formimidoyltransferase-cyclodeaminase (Formiminotransferase-cyclodeaminase) [candidate division NC10 bacterium]